MQVVPWEKSLRVSKEKKVSAKCQKLCLELAIDAQEPLQLKEATMEIPKVTSKRKLLEELNDSGEVARLIRDPLKIDIFGNIITMGDAGRQRDNARALLRLLEERKQLMESLKEKGFGSDNDIRSSDG